MAASLSIRSFDLTGQNAMSPTTTAPILLEKSESFSTVLFSEDSV